MGPRNIISKPILLHHYPTVNLCMGTHSHGVKQPEEPSSMSWDVFHIAGTLGMELLTSHPAGERESITEPTSHPNAHNKSQAVVHCMPLLPLVYVEMSPLFRTRGGISQGDLGSIEARFCSHRPSKAWAWLTFAGLEDMWDGWFCFTHSLVKTTGSTA